MIAWLKVITAIGVAAGVLLAAGTVKVAVSTPSRALETPPSTAEELILHTSHFAEGVTSLQFTETLGSVPDDYSKVTWEEVGTAYRVEEFIVNTRKGIQRMKANGFPANTISNFHALSSYDGEHGYKFVPDQHRLYIQKAPFPRADSDYDPSIRGPLMPFEFLLSGSMHREKIVTLQSSDYLASVARRATLQPDKNRSWNGHPCVAVKIVDGYFRWEPEIFASVDYIAYFATDLDYYPIAWEMYDKKGAMTYSYRVGSLKSLPLSRFGSAAFRYPDAAYFRYEPYKMEDKRTFQDVEVNTLTKKDLALDPALADYVQDLDTKTLTPVQK